MANKIQMSKTETLELYIEMMMRETENGQVASGQRLCFIYTCGDGFDDTMDGSLGYYKFSDPQGGYVSNDRHEFARSFLLEEGYLRSTSTGIIDLTKKGLAVL